MKNIQRSVLGILLVLCACTFAAADSSVWKAQKKDSVIYLGGTFHILRDSDFPLPPEFQKAYQASDRVAFETDMSGIQDPSTQQKILAKSMYSDGSTLASHLSPRVYNRLQSYCDANGIPLQALSKFKPGLVMTTLALLELTKLEVHHQGVDAFFYEQAQKDHKAINALESLDAQIDFLVSMADGMEDDFVLHSIEEMRSLSDLFEKMATAWRKGDVGKLEELMVTDLKKQPLLYQRLIVDRNRSWLPFIDAQQKSPRPIFILVGAAHLVGPDGLIAELKKRGYRVDKL